MFDIFLTFDLRRPTYYETIFFFFSLFSFSHFCLSTHRVKEGAEPKFFLMPGVLCDRRGWTDGRTFLMTSDKLRVGHTSLFILRSDKCRFSALGRTNVVMVGLSDKRRSDNNRGIIFLAYLFCIGGGGAPHIKLLTGCPPSYGSGVGGGELEQQT